MIIIATNNAHKLQEIREILGTSFDIRSLADIGCHEDIPETGQTLEENAWQKADYIYEHYGPCDCFADDTGLEVEALGGEPGVHSARYAEGTDHDSEANMDKLLRKLEGHRADTPGPPADLRRRGARNDSHREARHRGLRLRSHLRSGRSHRELRTDG